MARVNILLKPILPVIRIKKNDNNWLTFNHFTSLRDFRPHEVMFQPPYLNEAGRFELKLIDDSDIILPNISNGNEVEMYVGKDDATKKFLMLGAIAIDRGFDTEDENTGFVSISGLDWGNHILQNRDVVGFWEQKLNADGTPDMSQAEVDRVKVSAIAKALLSNRTSYPSQNLTAVEQGIIIDDNPASAEYSFKNIYDVPVARFSALIEKLKDKLRELANFAGGAEVGVKTNKKFFMRRPELTPSGLFFADDYEDSDLITYSQTQPDKVGLISYRKPTSFRISAVGYAKQLIGVGTGKPEIESQQSTVSASDVASNYLALKLPAIVQISADSIALFISKVGNPPDLRVRMVEDNGLAGTSSKPEGSDVDEWTEDKARISASGEWHFFPLRGHVLNSLRRYWIYIAGTGDALNAYRWHKDASATYVRASSPTGVDGTWTTTENTYGYAFQYRYTRDILSVLPNDVKVIGGNSHFPDMVVRQPDITSTQAMDDYLDAIAQTVFYETMIYKCSIFSSNVIPENGNVARIRVQKAPRVSARFDYPDWILSGLKYHWKASPKEKTGTHWFDLTATRLDR